VPSSRDFTKLRIFNRRKPTAILSYFWLEKIKPYLKKENTEPKDSPVTPEETPSE
jgi:hypothetical protein